MVTKNGRKYWNTTAFIFTVVSRKAKLFAHTFYWKLWETAGMNEVISAAEWIMNEKHFEIGLGQRRSSFVARKFNSITKRKKHKLHFVNTWHFVEAIETHNRKPNKKRRHFPGHSWCKNTSSKSQGKYRVAISLNSIYNILLCTSAWICFWI